jgi:hypothetical protein
MRHARRLLLLALLAVAAFAKPAPVDPEVLDAMEPVVKAHTDGIRAAANRRAALKDVPFTSVEWLEHEIVTRADAEALLAKVDAALVLHPESVDLLAYRVQLNQYVTECDLRLLQWRARQQGFTPAYLARVASGLTSQGTATKDCTRLAVLALEDRFAEDK